jgi:hypothetical protein
MNLLDVEIKKFTELINKGEIKNNPKLKHYIEKLNSLMKAVRRKDRRERDFNVKSCFRKDSFKE